MTTFTIGTLFLISTVTCFIFGLATTIYFNWKFKDMEQAKKHYKGCTELYREFHKQDFNENAVEEFEQSLKDMFESFKKK